MDRVSWKALGLVIKHEKDSVIVDLASYREVMTLSQIEKLLHFGLYFYSPVHHVTLDKIEQFEPYIIKYSN